MTDIEKVLKRCRTYLIENIGSNSAEHFIDSQSSDGSWNDIDYNDQNPSDWNPIKHLERIKCIAVFSIKTGDNRAKVSVCQGLKFWFDNNPVCVNWWYNDIGKQIQLREIAVIADEFLTHKLKANILDILNDDIDLKWSGANLVWLGGNIFFKGVINRDVITAKSGIRYIESTIHKSGEGIQADYAFAQHGMQLYNNGYGRSYLIDMISYMWFVHKTELCFTPEGIDKLTNMLLRGNRFMFRYKSVDFLTEGREVSRYYDDSHPDMTVYLPYLDMLQCINPKKQKEIAQMREHIRGNSDNPGDCGFHRFPSVKYATFTCNEFFASVKMFAKDIVGTEDVNDENILSGYTSFGTNPIMVSGNEYKKIFAAWDWGHLPGVTGYAFELPAKYGKQTDETFVSSVGHGMYGAAAMKLNTAFPMPGNKDNSHIHYHKSYFFFEGIIVTLISDLCADGDVAVHSTLNQCRQNGNIPKFDSKLGKCFWHDNIGYIIPNDCSANILTGKRSGKWARITKSQSAQNIVDTQNIFLLYIDHGIKPKGDCTNYIVVPGKSEIEFEEFAKNSCLQIISNTSALQAVCDPIKGIVQAVFYESGNYKISDYDFCISKPCLVTYAEPTAKLVVSQPVDAPVTIGITRNGKAVDFSLEIQYNNLRKGV